MEFIDLGTQLDSIKKNIDQRIQTVLSHRKFILGPEVEEFEKDMASYLGVKHAIGVANGTDALLICLRALDVKAGDKVVVPAFSFFATAEVVSQLGAKPVFADIDPDTYNMDKNSLEKVLSADSKKEIKAIMPVSLYGLCADFDAINTVAAKYNIPVIEDAAQSFGAIYKGKRSGNLAKMTATSFFPAKPLGCYGDGGAIFTNDDKLAEKVKQLRFHGQVGRYNHAIVGYNSRLDTIQAAILIEKLKIFTKEMDLREEAAQRYNKMLAGKVKTPVVPSGLKSVWAQYTIETKDRDGLGKALGAKGIPTSVHYPKSLHQQPVYEGQYTGQSFPKSEYAASHVISLPMHPYLTEKDQKQVCDAIMAAL